VSKKEHLSIDERVPRCIPRMARLQLQPPVWSLKFSPNATHLFPAPFAEDWTPLIASRPVLLRALEPSSAVSLPIARENSHSAASSPQVLTSMNYSAILHQKRHNCLAFHDILDTFASTNLIDSTKQLHRITRLYGVQPVSGCCGRIEGFKKYPAVAAAGR